MFVCPFRRWISPYLTNIKPPDSRDRIRAMTLMSTDPLLSPCQVTIRYMAAMTLTSRGLLDSVKNHDLKETNWTFIAFQGFVKNVRMPCRSSWFICVKIVIKFVIDTLRFHFKIITLWCTFYDFVVEIVSTFLKRKRQVTPQDLVTFLIFWLLWETYCQKNNPFAEIFSSVPLIQHHICCMVAAYNVK